MTELEKLVTVQKFMQREAVIEILLTLIAFALCFVFVGHDFITNMLLIFIGSQFNSMYRNFSTYQVITKMREGEQNGRP